MTDTLEQNPAASWTNERERTSAAARGVWVRAWLASVAAAAIAVTTLTLAFEADEASGGTVTDGPVYLVMASAALGLIALTSLLGFAFFALTKRRFPSVPALVTLASPAVMSVMLGGFYAPQAAPEFVPVLVIAAGVIGTATSVQIVLSARTR